MGGEDKTRLIVVADVKWDKPCLLRSRIETESFSGLKKYYEIFETELHTEKAITEKASLLEASRHHQEKGSKSSNSQNSNNSNRKTAQNKSEHVTTAQSQQHPRTIKISSRNPTSSSATKTQKTRQIDSSKGVMQQQQQQRRTLSFNETSVLIAFILVILTLLIITMAMFKLAGSIGALSERLYTLEDLLAQYSKECQFVNKNTRTVP